MSGFWRVDEALEDSEGLRWIRERLGAYDWSKADWISVRRGRSEKYGFRGVCKMPRSGSGYRINCNVSEYAAYPIYQYMRVPPLYRNPDGTWPMVTAALPPTGTVIRAPTLACCNKLPVGE